MLAIALLALGPAKVEGTVVLLTVKNHNGANSGLQVNFIPKNRVLVETDTIFAGNAVVTNLTGGQVYVELVPDDYTVIFGGVPNSFTISVFDTNVVLRAETLSTNLVTYTYTNLLERISGRVLAGSHVSIATNAAGTALETITMSASLTGGGGSGVNVAAGSNLSAVTNGGGDLVTLSADVSHTEVSNATNGLSGVLVTRITNATNDLNTTLTTKITNATNDLNTVLSATIAGKQASGNYLTALTGDGTASGPGSAALTLATVATPGTYRSVTVNAKGLVTAGTAPTTFSGYGISDTSANLAGALTDETGSGAAVFAAAPTLTGNVIDTGTLNVGSNGVAPAGITLDAEGATRVNGTLSVSNSAVIQGASLVLPTGSINVPAGTVTANLFSGNGGSLTAIPATSLTATTSAQLAGVLSDETGSGAAVFAISPALRGTATADTIVATNFTGNAIGATNISSTNIFLNLVSDLAPTSNQTNYTIALLPGPSGNPETIWLKNTNVFFSAITGTNNAGWTRTVILRGDTNNITLHSTIKFGTAVAVWTNANFVAFTTNGWQRVLNFYNEDTAGTNVLVSDAAQFHF